MRLVLREDMFINNRLVVRYSDKEAVFTIIDEEFAGLNRLGRINRITCLVYRLGQDGRLEEPSLCTTVIGMGDSIVGVRTDEPQLRGELLTHENMDRCVVELYE
jgi:hypothetical protein